MAERIALDLTPLRKRRAELGVAKSTVYQWQHGDYCPSLRLMPTIARILKKPLPDRPSCVVLDLRLPGPSGLELQESLIQERREVPIVFISGHADVPSSVRAIKAGAIDFLQKPFSDQALLDIIQRALRNDREARKGRAELAAIRQRFDTLTPRERDVLGLVVQGRLNKQIAGDLGISEKTVKFHRGRVMEKTQAGSVAELVRQSDRLGLWPQA